MNGLGKALVGCGCVSGFLAFLCPRLLLYFLASVSHHFCDSIFLSIGINWWEWNVINKKLLTFVMKEILLEW